MPILPAASTRTQPKAGPVSASTATVPRRISPARWSRMSPQARLLAIAKDVLAQLDAARFKPTRGVYLEGRLVSALSKLGDPTAVRDRLLSESKASDCRACAVGSMWLSRIRLADGVDGYGVLDWSSVREETGYNQSYDIEEAFESAYSKADARKGFHVYEDGYAVTLSPSERFGALYPRPADRLRAIMGNIVANRGVFRPEQAFEAEAEEGAA